MFEDADGVVEVAQEVRADEPLVPLPAVDLAQRVQHAQDLSAC